MFNGLTTVLDTLSRTPLHGIPANWINLPQSLAANKPSIPNVVVLNRGDSLILYLPNIKDAADYRAYIYDPAKVTINSSGHPRGAVIACAGYRQRQGRGINSFLAGGNYSAIYQRELLQAVEVPGLVADGVYNVVIEAIASPCPFPGVMSHTNATVPISGGLWVGTNFNFRSFNDVKAIYGNEIINGQGSTAADYRKYGSPNNADYFPAGPVSVAVSPTDANIPADPTVIARSIISVTRPAADEAINAPVIDVGTNAVYDEFANDEIMTSFKRESRTEAAGLVSGGQFRDWYFWMAQVQQAFKGDGSMENGENPKGAQVWTRHGRLYNTFSDYAQVVMGGMYFTSTKTGPLQLDTSQYAHSFFRVDSSATSRRYWAWMMCGADSKSRLVNTSTNIPLTRPVVQPGYHDPGGKNPTGPLTQLGDVASDIKYNLECLNVVQIGGMNPLGKPAGAAATWFDEPHSALHAFINPAGLANGVINLKPAGINDGDTAAKGGMFWRLNAARQPTQPMFEPFDQMAPLTHFDVFVRHDRVIFYINGRQAWCGDLSERPLQMKYGVISYGNVLYHSTAETPENYFGAFGGSGAGIGATGGMLHYLLNTPWSDTRTWDAVGQSEKIGIPSQFTFDQTACFKPQSIAVR